VIPTDAMMICGTESKAILDLQFILEESERPLQGPTFLPLP